MMVTALSEVALAFQAIVASSGLVVIYGNYCQTQANRAGFAGSTTAAK